MLGIPRTVLDVRSRRTQVGRVSMGETLVSRRKMATAEELEDNLSQRRMEMLEACVVGNVVELQEKEEGTSRQGWRSKNRAHEDQGHEPWSGVPSQV